MIEFNFEKAYRQVKELNDISQEMDRIANRSMGEAIQGIASAWTGESASKYLAKAEKVQTEIRNAGKSVNTASVVLLGITKMLEMTEDTVTGIAQGSGGQGGGGGW